MSVFQINNLSFQCPQGEPLFNQLNWHLSAKLSALIGRNGAGKSVLIKIITGQLKAKQGQIICHNNIGYFNQHDNALLHSTQSIAEFLQLDAKLKALKAIAQGRYNDNDLTLIGDDWLLEEKLTAQLTRLNIPSELTLPCHHLSGGQLTKLKLWQLFSARHDVLILDEPSNHLDHNAKQWLIEQIKHYPGKILVVTHDIQLLQHIELFYELTPRGIDTFKGNYEQLIENKQRHEQALQQQLNQIQQAQRKQQMQMQANHEKAQQRAAQGKAIRKQGSQAKVLLDKKRDKATAASKARKTIHVNRQQHLAQSYELLKAKQSEEHHLKLTPLNTPYLHNNVILKLLSAKLPFGVPHLINLIIKGNEKWHLRGENGSGKSTLFNVLLKKQVIKEGLLHINTDIFSIDQHYQLLDTELTILAIFTQYCPTLSHSQARTQLAGIGFKRDRVYSPTALLSGGEKMKLAMLIACSQPEQPLLLLDEPDNHLDIASKHYLATVLKAYQGAFILISHDKYFVSCSGVTNTYFLHPDH